MSIFNRLMFGLALFIVSKQVMAAFVVMYTKQLSLNAEADTILTLFDKLTEGE